MLNKKTLVIAISSLFIGIIGTSIVLVYAPLVYPNPQYISGGVYPQADFTFWRDGSYYFAKNSYGRIPSWGYGTNLTTIFQTAIDETPEGEIRFLEGTFELDKRVIPHGKLGITGSGILATRLKMSDSSNDVMFFWNGSTNEYFFRLENLIMDGNKDNNAYGTGIYFDHANGGEMNDVHIEHVWIENFTESGIDSDFGWGWRVTDSVVEHCGASYGVLFRSYASGGILKGNTLNSNDRNGVGIQGYRMIMTKNIINNNGYHGIELDGAYDILIDGNVIKANSRNQTGAYSGISITGGSYYTKISNNVIMGSQGATTYHEHQIDIKTSSDNYTQIIGNTFRDMTSSHLNNAGYFTEVKFNWGFNTESSIYDASVTNGDWIAHGLAGQPTMVQLTVRANAVVYVNSLNATHIQIGLSASPQAVYIYAEYHP